MNHKITTSTHVFTHQYERYPKQEVTVRLEIDHISKRYSIYPDGYTNNKSNNRFFFNSGGNGKKWGSLIEAIQAANEYAQQELFGTKEIVEG